MSSTTTYFLIKFYGNGSYVAYGCGISSLGIPDLHMCRIMRWYPAPMIDITPQLEKLQRHWRAYLRWRRWYMAPRRLQERAIRGYWVPTLRNVLSLSQQTKACGL